MRLNSRKRRVSWKSLHYSHKAGDSEIGARRSPRFADLCARRWGGSSLNPLIISKPRQEEERGEEEVERGLFKESDE
jgi:hypothetical protein